MYAQGLNRSLLTILQGDYPLGDPGSDVPSEVGPSRVSALISPFLQHLAVRRFFPQIRRRLWCCLSLLHTLEPTAFVDVWQELGDFTLW